MKLLVLLTAVLAVGAVDVLNIEDDNILHIPQSNEYAPIPEDAKLLVPELIKKYGYPVEVHTITTEDGYVLEMHRIPGDGTKNPTGEVKPIILQHGILCSSADFITPGPDNGFGYILADAGYDVWLPNIRGNRYSRKHASLDPDKNAKKFWNFSWHEIATIDLPTIIDYVLAQTKTEKLYYVGHSQGSTIFYVLLSEKPEYNNKVHAMVTLAPISYMKHMTSPILKIISNFQFALDPISKLIGIYEFLPHSKLLGVVGATLCGDDSIFQILCTNSMFAVLGFNRKQMNASLIPVITGHTPAGCSTKQMLHFGQLHKSGKFRQYDYGIFKNRKIYGKMSPPKYNLKKVTVPVYLYYSKNDWMSNQKDVLKLAKELGNMKGKFLVPDNKFNHIDYLFGIEAPSLVYKRVIGLLARH